MSSFDTYTYTLCACIYFYVYYAYTCAVSVHIHHSIYLCINYFTLMYTIGEDITSYLEAYKNGIDKPYTPTTKTLNMGASALRPITLPAQVY